MNRPKKKKIKKEKKIGKLRVVTRSIADVFKGNILSKGNVAGNLTFILFLTLMLIGYIAYGYYTDKVARNISVLENQLEELRSDFQTTKKDLNQISLQSQVALSVAQYGLKESVDPPKKIVIPKKSKK